MRRPLFHEAKSNTNIITVPNTNSLTVWDFILQAKKTYVYYVDRTSTTF